MRKRTPTSYVTVAEKLGVEYSHLYRVLHLQRQSPALLLTKYNEQELEALLGDDSKPVFVFEDGEVLGHAFCLITEVRDDKLLQDIKTLYIDDICVDEKARGHHVGKALYEHVRDYAKSIGCNNITLNVWEGNNSAISFYKNMGMKVQKTTMEIKL